MTTSWQFLYEQVSVDVVVGTREIKTAGSDISGFIDRSVTHLSISFEYEMSFCPDGGETVLERRERHEYSVSIIAPIPTDV